MARKITFQQAINEALDQEMARDESVIVMGEDVVGGTGSDGEMDAWGGVLGAGARQHLGVRAAAVHDLDVGAASELARALLALLHHDDVPALAGTGAPSSPVQRSRTSAQVSSSVRLNRSTASSTSAASMMSGGANTIRSPITRRINPLRWPFLSMRAPTPVSTG